MYKFVTKSYSTGDFNTDFAQKIDNAGITNGQILFIIVQEKVCCWRWLSTGNFNTDFATKSIHDLTTLSNTGLADNRVLIYNHVGQYEPRFNFPNPNTTNSFVDEFTANGGTASFTLSQDLFKSKFIDICRRSTTAKQQYFIEWHKCNIRRYT